MRYVPVELIEEWRRRDPIELQERRLAEIEVTVAAVRAAVEVEIEAGVREALEMPMPDPATATEGVFAEGEAQELGDGAAPWSGFSTPLTALPADASAPAPSPVDDQETHRWAS